MSTHAETVRAALIQWAQARGEQEPYEDVVALDALSARLAALEAGLATIQAHVDEQAEDESLWSVPAFNQQPISEAYLQQELRALHSTIEKALAVLAAAGRPEGEGTG